MKGKNPGKILKKWVYNNFEMVSSDKYKCNLILFALPKQISHVCSPRNENLNLLVQIKFLNLFLYI